jgi:cation transport ATPase
VNPSSANLIQISEDPLVVPRLLELSKNTQKGAITSIVSGLVISTALTAGAVFGLPAPALALIGVLTTWWLHRSQVRLLK